MYKEKLIELLKTVPKIKQDLEELRFWTIIKYNTKFKWKDTRNYFRYKWEWEWDNENYLPPYKMINNQAFIIIWNELEERHLRMYCESKNIKYIQYVSWLIELKIRWEIHKSISMDNSKSFSNQSEDFYEKLYNYLITIE
jgi:hypothetical protein